MNKEKGESSKALPLFHKISKSVLLFYGNVLMVVEGTLCVIESYVSCFTPGVPVCGRE